MILRLSNNRGLIMHVRLKEKGQVTIPAALRAQIHAETGDVFEAVVDSGNIVLRPQIISERGNLKTKGVDIRKWMGAGKGLFNTPAEVQAFIRAEREQWE
jgi:AbrB family looped-hinge helix DNA binding protein